MEDEGTWRQLRGAGELTVAGEGGGSVTGVLNEDKLVRLQMPCPNAERFEGPCHRRLSIPAACSSVVKEIWDIAGNKMVVVVLS